MIKTPEELLQRWMRCVNEGDASGLLALYNERAVLIPTFSNRLLTTPEGVEDYFLRLVARKDLSIALHEKTVRFQKIQGEVYAASGIYCWRFMVEEEMLSFEARFSYVFDLSLEAPILQHHSSQIPRML